MLNKRLGTMSEDEKNEQRELYKQLNERIKQLRMRDLPELDEEEKD